MNMFSKSLLVVAGCFSYLIGSVIQAAPITAETDPAKLYLKQCSICHGDKGDGNTRAQSGMNPKPRDFTTAEAAMELTRERMILSVTYGRPGTAMVAHEKRLSEQQIADIVDYIRTNFMRVPVAEASGAPESVSLGEKIYVKNCSVCHGDKGNSAFWAQNGLNPPPRDFTSPEAHSTLTRERMINSVTNGRPGTGMMPFKTRLSGEEIQAVVAFIRFKFMGVSPDKDTGETPMKQLVSTSTGMSSQPQQRQQKVETLSSPHAGGIPGIDAPLGMGGAAGSQTSDPHQGPHSQTPGMPGGADMSMAGMPQGHEIDADMSLPIPGGLKADLKWGREFYMKNCFTCHGVKGDGNGPRAYFNIPRPRNFTSDASRRILNRPRIFDSITKGKVATVMPAWGKVLTEQEIANLTEFVFRAFIQGKGAEVSSSDNNSKKKAG